MPRAAALLFTLALTAAAQDPMWRNHEALNADLKATGAKTAVIGRSQEGRDILVVTLGTGDDVDSRPALLVIAGVEADNLVGSELAAEVTALLAASADERTKALLAERTVYVLARLNPDGMERAFSKVKREDSGTARPWDEDRDGEADEDGPEDLDGDGAITWMRVEDGAGEWLADGAEPGFLRKALVEKGERGAYRLYVEGTDTDGDGSWNEDGPGGVDLNSNFTWNYRAHGARSGPYQVSEPESRALAEFVLAHPNIEAVFTFSSNDNCIRQVAPAAPPASVPEPGGPLMAIDGADVLFFARAAEAYRAKVGGDRKDPGPLREGGVAEWAYFHMGVLSLASPGWTMPWKAPDKAPPEDAKVREEREVLRWLKKNRPAAVAEWKAFEHPDFPGRKVEIGGVRPFMRENPDPAEIPALARKHADFFREMLGSFPRLQLRDAKVTGLDDGVFEVTATLFNEGSLPTALAQGGRTRRALKWRATLFGADVVAGDNPVSGGALAPFNGSRELRWIVSGAAGTKIEIMVEGGKAGRAAWKGELK